MKPYSVHPYTLLQGDVPPVLFDFLADEATRMTSESCRAALRLHFVDGWAEKVAYETTGASQGNFSRAKKSLNNAYTLMENYQEVKTQCQSK